MAGGGLSFTFFPFFLPSPFTFGVLGGLEGLGVFGVLDGLSCLAVFTVLGVFFLGSFSRGGGRGVTWTGDGASSFSTGQISSAAGLALMSALLVFEAFCGLAQSTRCSDMPVLLLIIPPLDGDTTPKMPRDVVQGICSIGQSDRGMKIPSRPQ